MPKIQEVKPPDVSLDSPSVSTRPAPKCRTVDQPDRGVQVSFLIEPEVAHRYRMRAGKIPLNEYLWENVLKRAIYDHVY